MAKNKISTPSYFIKRLRDNGFYVCRIFDKFNEVDPREWTVLLNPEHESIFITYYSNKTNIDDTLFEFSDGGMRFPKNFQLKTDSIEVVITFLFAKGVQTTNTYYETETEQT